MNYWRWNTEPQQRNLVERPATVVFPKGHENTGLDLAHFRQIKLGLMQDLLTSKVPVKVDALATANG